MRKPLLCCLLLGAAVPGARAQMQKGLFGAAARPGTYVLNDDRKQRRAGRLKVYAHELVVKDEHGDTWHYAPGAVYRVQVGPVRYATIGGFRVAGGFWDAKHSKPLFVEVVDSGQVSLYRYRYTVGGTDNEAHPMETYLLHLAATDSVVAVAASATTGQGRRFRETLAPYLASRPDLLLLVTNGVVAVEDLPELLHALNTQAPFMPPHGREVIR